MQSDCGTAYMNIMVPFLRAKCKYNYRIINKTTSSSFESNIFKLHALAWIIPVKRTQHSFLEIWIDAVVCQKKNKKYLWETLYTLEMIQLGERCRHQVMITWNFSMENLLVCLGCVCSLNLPTVISEHITASNQHEI